MDKTKKSRSFRELRERLDAQPGASERTAKAHDEMIDELAAHQRSLTELRRARSYTQDQLARQLGVTQPEVSRIEHQADLFVSTLRSYVAAMGGELRMVAQFDDQPPVVLSMEDVMQAAFHHDESERGAFSG